MERILDWNNWFYGLVATAVNGFFSGVVLVIADPAEFNIYDGREKLIMTSLVMGVWGAANYLKSNPLPKPVEVPADPPTTLGL